MHDLFKEHLIKLSQSAEISMKLWGRAVMEVAWHLFVGTSSNFKLQNLYRLLPPAN